MQLVTNYCFSEQSLKDFTKRKQQHSPYRHIELVSHFGKEQKTEQTKDIVKVNHLCFVEPKKILGFLGFNFELSASCTYRPSEPTCTHLRINTD